MHHDSRHLTRFAPALAGLALILSRLPADARSLDARVLGVSDGDTVVVQVLGRRETIRLLGIDAPEIAHGEANGQEPWGSRALQFARTRLLARNVRLQTESRERDRYGRLLAYVYVAGRCFNLDLVQAGLALAETRGAQTPLAITLNAAQRTAQAKALGIWQRVGGLKEKPGDYRARWRDGDWSPPFGP